MTWWLCLYVSMVPLWDRISQTAKRFLQATNQDSSCVVNDNRYKKISLLSQNISYGLIPRHLIIHVLYNPTRISAIFRAHSIFMCSMWLSSKELGVNGRIILKRIFKEWYGEAWTGLIWLRMSTGSGSLWMRQWNFGFHKILGICLAEELLLASHERLGLMD